MIKLLITTNGFVRNGIFDAQYDYAKAVIEGKVKDDHFLPFIYELDNIDEWDKPEASWKEPYDRDFFCNKCGADMRKRK